jgi:hypothetical protein
MRTSREVQSGFRLVLGLACVLAVGAGGTTTLAGQGATGPAALQTVADNLPLRFERNLGQTDEQVRFLSRGRGYNLYLTATEAVFVSGLRGPSGEADGSAVLRMQIVGASPDARVTGLEELPGRTHYYRGNDPAKWRTGVAGYARVAYKRVYTGVDLVYYGNQGRLEYDFNVASGIDPKVIRLRFEGAEALTLDPEGNLILKTPAGDIVQHAPVFYQMAGGIRQTLHGRYVLRSEKDVGFEVTDRDPDRSLVIDPVLSFSTYLGGSLEDNWLVNTPLALGTQEMIYIAGTTESVDFPGGGVPLGTEDCFVSKLDLSQDGASQLVYTAFVGGSGQYRFWSDLCTDLAVDNTGHAYVTGHTTAVDFPTTPGAFSTTLSGFGDAVVFKLSPDGSALVYSTFIGGTGEGNVEDQVHSIALDSDNNAYLTGAARSSDFPVTAGAYDTSFNGPGKDAFVAKLSADGSTLLYSTFLGGSERGEEGTAIAVDAAGIVYVAGWTRSTDFPTTPGAFDSTFKGFNMAYIAKLDPAGNGGSDLLYSSLLGGSNLDNGDWVNSIAVDQAGNVYMTGDTASVDFPTTPGTFEPSFTGVSECRYRGGNLDCPTVFVLKLNPAGNGSGDLAYSTFLSGGTKKDRDRDSGSDIVLDQTGNVWVTGDTGSAGFPTTSDALDTMFSDGEAFAAKLSLAGNGAGDLLFSTFLGGSGEEIGGSIALDPAGNVYIAGVTISDDFPTTTDAFDRTYNGGRDLFVSKIEFAQSCATAADCNDSNECTVDACVGGVCQNTPAADDTTCDAGASICCGGSCVAAACTVDLDCDDGDTCSTDTCIGAGTCAAVCDATFPSCGPADGCCGPGCTSANDSDCPDVCVPTHNNEKGPRCSDGIDNDCDGLIDGADPDC